VPSSTVSPYDSYFHWVIKNKLKYIPEDEFDSLRNKYRAKLKELGFVFDNYQYDYIKLKPEKELIKLKTKEYLNLFKEYIKKLVEINKKYNLDDWLKKKRKFSIKI